MLCVLYKLGGTAEDREPDAKEAWNVAWWDVQCGLCDDADCSVDGRDCISEDFVFVVVVPVFRFLGR